MFINRRTLIILAVVIFFLVGLLIGPFLVPVPALEGTVPPRQLAYPHSRFIEIEGIEIHYEEAGSGQPVFLLMHGFAASTFSWRGVISPLSETGRAVAYDRPAFGLTARPMEWNGRNPYASETQPHLAVALIDALEVDQAILVGNSAGGTVAVQTALEYPDRVQALVLVSPALYGSGSPSWIRPFLNTPQLNHLGPLIARSFESRGLELAASAWHDPDLLTPEIYEGYTRPLQAENWDRALWELTRASRIINLPEQLERLALPVLVISGDDDRIVSIEDSRRAAEEIPGAYLVELESCGHVPQEECPQAFLEAVSEFLDRLE
jgi:pimeloyl-ACP methyl ester carboxylesterase